MRFFVLRGKNKTKHHNTTKEVYSEKHASFNVVCICIWIYATSRRHIPMTQCFLQLSSPTSYWLNAVQFSIHAHCQLGMTDEKWPWLRMRQHTAGAGQALFPNWAFFRIHNIRMASVFWTLVLRLPQVVVLGRKLEKTHWARRILKGEIEGLKKCTQYVKAHSLLSSLITLLILLL